MPHLLELRDGKLIAKSINVGGNHYDVVVTSGPNYATAELTNEHPASPTAAQVYAEGSRIVFKKLDGAWLAFIVQEAGRWVLKLSDRGLTQQA